MNKQLFTNRRRFLQGMVAAAGTTALGVSAPLAKTALAATTDERGILRGTTYPLNTKDATLSAVTNSITLHTPHVVKEIAPDTPYELWTFEGSGPGPAINVMEGEPVDFTMINDSGMMPHSIDFHAALLPWDKYYQAVNPGEEHKFTWTPKYPGVFMYHCGTPPVLLHLINGMHGAIIVQPKAGWPEKADREYVLVQHEYYLGQPDDQGVYRGDYLKATQVQPDFVVFNGYANQYQTNPLVANPGELIRLYVCNAGPTTYSAFHVIGTLFTACYADGNPANKQVGMQTVTIPPGGGYVVEMRIPDEGYYPFVTHSFAYTGKGALGVIKVGNPPPLGEGMSH